MGACAFYPCQSQQLLCCWYCCSCSSPSSPSAPSSPSSPSCCCCFFLLFGGSSVVGWCNCFLHLTVSPHSAHESRISVCKFTNYILKIHTNICRHCTVQVHAVRTLAQTPHNGMLLLAHTTAQQQPIGFSIASFKKKKQFMSTCKC